MSSATYKFREKFTCAAKTINWFPGHMFGSLKHMQAKLRKIDCAIEVHDARIPFSGRNPLLLRNIVGSKPHILVLNKKDLIDSKNYFHIKERLKEENCENVVFTECTNQNCKDLKRLLPKLTSLLLNDQLLKPPVDTYSYKIMVVGIPNVGKSSLINALRGISLSKGKAAPVGALPGLTKSVQNEIKINENPRITLIDTPGILMPNFSDVHTGLKLGLCACVKDEIIGVTVLADFLLYCMNKIRNFDYVDIFNLTEPSDEILPVLVQIANNNNKSIKIKNINNNTIQTFPDIQFSAQLMLKLFRKGKLGDLCLDL